MSKFEGYEHLIKSPKAQWSTEFQQLMIKEKLDEKWFKKLYEIIGNNYPSLSRGINPKNYSEEKTNFLSNPDNYKVSFQYKEYEDFSKEYFSKMIQNLKNLKSEIYQECENPLIGALYIARINEFIAESKIHEMILSSDKDPRNAYFIQKLSEFIWGKLNKNETMNLLSHEVNEIYNNKKENVSDYEQYLHPLLEFVKGYDKTAPETLENDMVNIDKKYEDIELNSEQQKELFEKILEVYNFSDWKVVLNKNSNNMATNSAKKIVILPEKNSLKLKRVFALIGHEIETHVLTYETGLESKLMLLSKGLDRYSATQEGLAVMNEKDVIKNIKLYVLLLCQEFPFHEAYKMLLGYLILRDTSLNKEININSLQEESFKLITRGKRGIKSTDKGATTKDITYNYGVKEVLSYLKEGGEKKSLYVGKFHLRQMPLLKELGINEPNILPLELGVELVEALNQTYEEFESSNKIVDWVKDYINKNRNKFQTVLSVQKSKD